MAIKIIIFKTGATAEDKAFAKACGMVVRDPSAITPTDFIEQCDAVCGEVPESYSRFEKIDTPTQEKQPKAPKQPKQPKAPTED